MTCFGAKLQSLPLFLYQIPAPLPYAKTFFLKFLLCSFSVVSSFLGIIPTYLNISYQKREKARKGEGREIFHCYLSNKSVCAAVTSTLLDNLHQPMLCAGQYLTSYLSYLKHFLQLKPVMPPLSPICYFTDHIIFVSFADTLYLLSLLNQCLSILSAHKNHLVSF